jgi:hypothetical protein
MAAHQRHINRINIWPPAPKSIANNFQLPCSWPKTCSASSFSNIKLFPAPFERARITELSIFPSCCHNNSFSSRTTFHGRASIPASDRATPSMITLTLPADGTDALNTIRDGVCSIITRSAGGASPRSNRICAASSCATNNSQMLCMLFRNRSVICPYQRHAMLVRQSDRFSRQSLDSILQGLRLRFARFRICKNK